VNIHVNPPKLSRLLDDHSRGAMQGSFSALPGVINTYDAELTTATVEIMLRRVVNSVTGETADYPMLLDVPVFQLTGGDGGVNLPIAVGDPCLVLFADRDIDNWFATGSAQPPNTPRIHSMADGMAIVGFRPLTNAVQRPDYAAVGVYKGGTQISIKNELVAIRNANKTLLGLIQTLIADINTAIGSASITASGADPQGGTVSSTGGVSGFTHVATDFTGLLYNGDNITP
jgi:hypothetical protein